MSNLDKNFIIKNINKEEVMVFSTHYCSPTHFLKEIENELKKKNFKGFVVFDLLLSHGNSSQRYYRTEFFNKFSFEELVNIKNNREKYIAFSSIFYRENMELINRSLILSNAQKFLIGKGRI